MKKQGKVVMLPTQRAENCIITNNGTVKKGIYYHKALLTQQYLKSICQESHHLYIITDDIIQDKDWCLFFDSNGNLFCNEPQQYLVKEGHVLNDGLKNIKCFLIYLLVLFKHILILMVI